RLRRRNEPIDRNVVRIVVAADEIEFREPGPFDRRRRQAGLQERRKIKRCGGHRSWLLCTRSGDWQDCGTVAPPLRASTVVNFRAAWGIAVAKLLRIWNVFPLLGGNRGRLLDSGAAKPDEGGLMRFVAIASLGIVLTGCAGTRDSGSSAALAVANSG